MSEIKRKTARQAVKKVAQKKTVKRATTKRTAAKKRTTAKRSGRKKASAVKTVSIRRAAEKEESALESAEASVVRDMLTKTAPKRRLSVERCMSGLYKVARACRPRSGVAAVGIFLLGVVVTLVALFGFIYFSKSDALLRLFIGAGTVYLDGVAIQVGEEIDPTFGNLIAHDIPHDFQDVTMDDFWQIWRYIEESYVPPPEKMTEGVATKEEDSLDRDALLTGAIKGLTRATKDRYTNFFLPKAANDFENEVLNGEIDGIGAYLTINDDDVLEVAKPIDDGPADKAGLRAGDLIMTIDGVDSSEYNLSEAADNIRGPRGTTVVLEIYRPLLEEELEIPIVRARVEIPTVETEVRDGVFVISLSTFTKITPKAFGAALQEFAESANAGGPDRLLLDLRGNMGGILSVSVYVAGMFLPADSPVLYEYSGTEKLKVYRTNKPAFQNGVFPKMTVLVDGATASAAEILAAALRHYSVADIVGTKTLGKGSVQAIKSVGDDNAILKITVAHWLTPAKESIGGEGVVPDVDYLEELEALYKEDPEVDISEVALKKAIEHLKQR